MRSTQILGLTCLMALAACGDSFDRETGGDNTSNYGNATMNNTMVQSGERGYTEQLAGRFSSEVTDTITFAFNSAQLDGSALVVLRQQADWIKQFPEVRFRVYGHTDLVGSDQYNKQLGLLRAQAVVAYFASQGISRDRLEALASFGETQPVVPTNEEEVRNRRTVTEVSGFVKRHSGELNGKYAAIIMRGYIASADRPHPTNTQIATQINPGG
jgi:peptidoglycan-associated lipoprotein